jgi:hypothetical protein
MINDDETLPATRWTTACRSRPPQTLAELLLYLPDAQSRRELEAYRVPSCRDYVLEIRLLHFQVVRSGFA